MSSSSRSTTTWLVLGALALTACDGGLDAGADGGRARDGGLGDGGLVGDGALAGDGAAPSETDGGGVVGDGGSVVVPPGCGTPAAIPEPVLGVAYYFSDCRTGAQPGCVPGDNANAGTSPDAPRRDLGGLDPSALPAGTQLLFARGGAWTGFRLAMRNLAATPESPIVLDAYAPSWGGSARPRLESDGTAIELGAFGTVGPHGGYRIRNVALVGAPGAQWGVWARDGARDVVIEGVEITGFDIGMHLAGSDELPITGLVARGCDIHHNVEMGVLGGADDLVIEGCTFRSNNASGSPLNHAIYLAGHSTRGGAIRDNLFDRNSVVDGACTGGNVTLHGVWDGLVIEGNTIVQDTSTGGCYGLSITAGYHSPEALRNIVLRGNTLVNLGCAICATAAPGILVENNVIYSDLPGGPAIAIGAPPQDGDAPDGAATIRNNTIYRPRADAGSMAMLLGRHAGRDVVVVSNAVYFGPDASDAAGCFHHEEGSSFATFANNLCHGARWGSMHATLADAQAAGLDAGGTSADPRFESVPSPENGWSATVAAESPAIDSGHPALSSATDRVCASRSAPDIGAYER